MTPHSEENDSPIVSKRSLRQLLPCISIPFVLYLYWDWFNHDSRRKKYNPVDLVTHFDAELGCYRGRISVKIQKSIFAQILTSRFARFKADARKRKCETHKLNGGESRDSHRTHNKNLNGFLQPQMKFSHWFYHRTRLIVDLALCPLMP